jgi:PTS system nitrogen regulatory IIA component
MESLSEFQMKLTVRDAAEILGVSEKRVYRWIEDGALPAYKMNEQYRINRAELLEWATDQQIPVSPVMFKGSEKESEDQSRAADALERGGVHRAVEGSTKEEALRSVVSLLPLPAETDREPLLEVLLAREALGSTAVGDGIAIPHVRNPIVLHVDDPIVSLCTLACPVDFGALDGKPVSTLFTIVTPNVRTHLHLLSRLAYLLKQPAFRGAVTRGAEAGEIVRIAREEERAVEERRAGTARA